MPSEVAKSVAWECGVEKGLNAVLGDGEGWLSENVVLVIVASAASNYDSS